MNADDLDLLRAASPRTSRYASWRPGDGFPVRTTVGAPRRRIPGLEFARLLAPVGLLDLPDDECERRYLARLDERAADVVAELAEIARRHPGEALCLLCFENVAAGQVCHRRWAASWLAERFGLDVPELTTLTLF